MDFYYKTQIEKLSPKCPPEDYKPLNKRAYRFVIDPITDPINFLSQGDKNEKRANSIKDENPKKCALFALSLFDTLQNSLEFFDRMLSNHGEETYRILGTHVAEGQLKNEDGLGEEPREDGHFNFHHVKSHDFGNRFKIIQAIPV